MSYLCGDSVCQVLLVDISDVTRNTKIYQGFDENSIKEYILTAQENFLAPLMRKADYCQLLSDKANNTLTPLQENFLIKITPYLVWLTYEQIFLQGSALSTDVGFLQFFKPDAQKVDNQLIREVLQAIRLKLVNFKALTIKAIYDVYNYPEAFDVMYNATNVFGISKGKKNKRYGCSRN